MSDKRGRNILNGSEYKGILRSIVNWLCSLSPCSPGANLNTFFFFSFLLTRWSYLTGIANPIQLALLPAAHLAESCWKNGLSARRHKLLLFSCQWFEIPVCFMGRQEILYLLGASVHRILPSFHLRNRFRYFFFLEQKSQEWLMLTLKSIKHNHRITYWFLGHARV